MSRRTEFFGSAVSDVESVLTIIAGILARPRAERDRARLGEALRDLEAMRPRLTRAVRAAEIEAEGSRAVAQEIGGTLRTLRATLKRWDQMVGRLTTNLGSEPIALLPPRPRNAPVSVQVGILGRAFQALAVQRGEGVAQAAVSDADGLYPDLPSDPARFTAQLHAAWRLLAARGRTPTARFLDVGCGSGSKLLIAACMFPEVHGIERDPGYLALARPLDDGARIRVIEGDAREFPDYAAYDVVHAYQPMRDEKLLALETWMIAHVRPGTVLVAPYDGFRDRAAGYGASEVAGGVYLCGTAMREAEAWATSAQDVGLDIPDPALLTPQGADGLWADVALRNRAEGFGA